MSYQESTSPDQMVTPTVERKNETRDMIETMREAETLSVFLSLIEVGGLEGLLRGPDLVTVFAPTNDALGKLPPEMLEDLKGSENRDRLSSFLRSHVMAGSHSAVEIGSTPSLKTLEGETRSVRVVGDTLFVDGAQLVRTDIVCTNGVFHEIDTVLA